VGREQNLLAAMIGRDGRGCKKVGEGQKFASKSRNEAFLSCMKILKEF
jgi:hypothetical protein